jgi:Carboxypeptidase regulatory-like domain/TonB-dependent Receptor Plug Domain
MLNQARACRKRLLPPARVYASAFLAILAFLGGPRLGWAQVAAAISGSVDDASGGAVTGATVTVKSLETGAIRIVATDEAGNFRVLDLPLGPQEVKAEKKGFKATIRTGINLEVGEEVVVDLRLEVGELVQEIIVSEGAPVVNTTTAPISGVVGEREVKDLPLNGRSFDNLITLNPGAINYSAMRSAQTSTSNGNTFTVAGRRTAENLFLLNGIEYTGSSQLAITPGGVSGELLGIDAVREFNILTDTYSAEYGKRAGAQVNIVTESGSNALHGSIFEFLRNSALDARSYFAQGTSPPFEQNQFGAAVGGPLKEDRWFLFGNYEGFRQALTVSNVAVVPDQQARQGFLPNASGVYTMVANLDPAMLQYMSFWPQPNGPELLIPASGLPSGTALSYNSPKQYIPEDFGTLRTDYTLGDRDTVSGAYTVDDGNSLVPLSDPLFASYSTLRMQVASVQETHMFSPAVLNTFRAGFSRAGFNLDSSLLASFPANLDFVTGAGPGGIVIGGGVTTTGVAALTSAGPNNAAGVSNRRNLFTYTDDVLISKGIHQIGFGAWFQRLQDNENSASRRLGQATFASLTTFLQGTVSTFQVVPSPTELNWRSLFGAWYAEDTIQIRRNLTVLAGIRHEFTTGWNEAFGRAANYLVGPSGVLLTNPRVGNSVFTQNNAKLLFSPRIGMAWDPFGNGKTAVRAAFGTYYSLIDDLAFLLNSVPPYNGALTFSGTLSSIVPIAPGVPLPPSCGPNVPAPCATYAPQGVQANAKTPTVEEWNLTVEQELNRSMAFRVAYVGSHGYHSFLSIDPNTIPAQICSDPSGCQAGGVATNGTPATAANQSHVAQGAEYIPVGRRPNPFLGAGFFWFTEGNSSYNALETEVTHRLSRGLQFRANYTWSKNLDVNSALTGAQASNQAQMVLDRNDLRRDWGPSALNVTSQAGISAEYELPFGRDKPWFNAARGLEGKLVSGWQWNGIATFLTGFPFTPLVGSNRSGDGDTRNPDRPSSNPNFSGPIILHNQEEWFNPNAFVLPAAGTYGNLRRGTFTGPGLADVDFSLLKNTSLTERTNLEFRAEFFNVFNRANFGPPNTTVFASGALSASAGLITTLATNPRQIQFGLKLIF